MMDRTESYDKINNKVYLTAATLRHYRSRVLDVAEITALLKYRCAFAGCDVLDMGVGTGRTARFLAPLAKTYVCFDYSPHMVRYMQEHFPGLRTVQADMRDLSQFGRACWDFVFAPNNVLDAVGQEDRLRVLRGVHATLRHGKIFIFSSHNRHFRHALQPPHLHLSPNPATQAKYLADYARSLVNFHRIRNFRQLAEHHAILNDEGHEYALLHYYITAEAQERQLHSTGFRLLEIFDMEGHSVSHQALSAESPSLLYVAQRNDNSADPS